MADGDLQPMLEVLKSVAVALKEDGVPFALAGGFAVYARGGQDSRHDVDFVVREADVAKARQALEERGIKTLEPPEDWLFKARHDNQQVDIIFRLASGPVDDDLLARTDERAVDSVLMPVLSATDLLVSKLRALTEHSCDFGPVLALMRSLREQLDVPFVNEASEGHPFAEAALFLARGLDVLPPTEHENKEE
jgi:Uncharacterised nucleotidyltransferase